MGHYVSLASANKIDPAFTYKSDIAGLILGFIAILPFQYLAVKLIRPFRLSLKTKVIPGIFFCMAMTLNLTRFVIKNFTFTYNYHGYDNNTYNKLALLPTEIGLLSRIYYFKSIIVVMDVFDVPGSKLFSLVTNILKYLFLALLVIRIIFAYVEVSEKVGLFFIGRNSFYNEFVIIFEQAFDTFCFVTLSVCFIFSNVKNYLPPKMKASLKITLFLYPCAIFVVNILTAVLDSYCAIMWFEVKKEANNFVYILVYLTYKTFDFLVVLAMVWILSVQNYHSEDIDKEKTVIDESLDKYLYV